MRQRWRKSQTIQDLTHSSFLNIAHFVLSPITSWKGWLNALSDRGLSKSCLKINTIFSVVNVFEDLSPEIFYVHTEKLSELWS